MISIQRYLLIGFLTISIPLSTIQADSENHANFHEVKTNSTEFWQHTVQRGSSPYDFFIKYKNYKDKLPLQKLPVAWQRLHKVVTLRGRITDSKPLSIQEYDNRWKVLRQLSPQSFFLTYQSIKNNKTFQKFATSKLNRKDVFEFLRSDFVFPDGYRQKRYHALKIPKSRIRKIPASQLLKQIPAEAPIEFSLPLIKKTNDRITVKQRMQFSRSRIKELARTFGVKIGRTGDDTTFKLYFDVYFPDYLEEAERMSKKLSLSRREAFQILAILTYIESQGYVFAVSHSGALGPLQHTYFYYLFTNPPTVPFDTKSSLRKTADKLIKYFKRYHSLAKVITAYHDGETDLRKAIRSNPVHWRKGISKNAKSYIQRFQRLLKKSKRGKTEQEIIQILANRV